MKEQKAKIKFRNVKIVASLLPLLFFTLIPLSSYLIPLAHADTTGTLSGARTPVDPTKSGFSLVACDGPKADGATGVVCDFNGLMITIQHLIDVAMVAGVFVALIGFVYAGFLYMTGKPGNIDHAKEMFRKIGIGFILMLTAWFIVYQLLLWLTGNTTYTTLLGKP